MDLNALKKEVASPSTAELLWRVDGNYVSNTSRRTVSVHPKMPDGRIGVSLGEIATAKMDDEIGRAFLGAGSIRQFFEAIKAPAASEGGSGVTVIDHG